MILYESFSDYQIGRLRFLATDHDGQPATERIFEQPSADGKSVLHTESLRLNSAPAAPWTETFRWTWTKQPQ